MFDMLFSPVTKGINLMRRGDFADAIVYFKALVQKNIRVQESYFNIGRCFFKLGNLKEAKAHLHKALDIKYSETLAADILEITNWKILSSYTYFNNWPSFSGDGRMIGYVSARRDTNEDGKINSADTGGIYITELDSGKEHYVVSDEYYNIHPQFSPDNKFLAFLSVRKKGPNKNTIDERANPGLYVLDLATGQEIQLLSDLYRIKHFVYAPDGKKIVFSGWFPGSTNSGIYEINILSGQIKVLVPDYYENTFPSLSPDGKYLLFSSWRRDTNKDGHIDFRDNSGIYIKNLRDNSEFLVASDEYNNIFPSFSPDGALVMFLSYRRDTNKDGIISSVDNPGLYTFHIEKKKERCTVDDTFFNKFPAFTPDGKSIVFLSSWRKNEKNKESEDFFENKGVYMINVSSGNVRKIVSDKYYGCYYPVVSPAGGTVAYISWRQKTNRGLFLATLDTFPDTKTLHALIDSNL